MTFDPLKALGALNDHGVRYVLIGGYASAILGAPIMTNDVDVCHERTPENGERLADALRDLGAVLRGAGVEEEERPFLLDGHALATGDSSTFVTEVGPVDIVATPSGTGGFRDLDADAATYDLGQGLLVRVASLDDLIRMKEAAHRAKDEVHLHVLAALKETIERREKE